MKILAVYATKTGTAEECLSLLARHLPSHEMTLCRLKKGTVLPSLDEYDVILVGSPVRMGRIDKRVRRFMNEEGERLKEKRTAYFLCCGLIDCFDEYAEKLIPRELRENAISVSCFGGDMSVDKQKNILDKMIVRSVRSSILGGGDNGDGRKDISLPIILDSNISQLAEVIKKNC